MTTIIGIQGDGFAVVCADSQVSDISSDGAVTQIVTLRESSGKLGANGRYILGAAGDVRAINILHHAFVPPAAPPNLKGKKLDQFITVKFIPALRECFEVQGYAAPQNEQSEHMAEQGSSVIVVINGVIYTVESDYSWFSDSVGIYALGTGAQYAMGALHTLTHKVKNLNINIAKQYLLKAMAAAAKFDPYTGAPYQTYVQEGEQTGESAKPHGKKKLTKHTGNPKKIGK
jgi:ATP-dependent protease HslVU (ClpYQ) peptidase subunit